MSLTAYINGEKKGLYPIRMPLASTYIVEVIHRLRKGDYEKSGPRMYTP